MNPLSDGDKAYIKLYEAGTKPSTAFREAYPDHEAVRFWHLTKGTDQHLKAREVLKDAAKNKLRTKHIQKALLTYQDKMEEFSALSLDTATDLVVNARSEKVRADLAMEGIRHKIGTPVQKVAVQEKKTVILQFGTPPEEVRDVIEGEVISDDSE
jgi:hypothetical protein